MDRLAFLPHQIEALALFLVAFWRIGYTTKSYIWVPPSWHWIIGIPRVRRHCLYFPLRTSCHRGWLTAALMTLSTAIGLRRAEPHLGQQRSDAAPSRSLTFDLIHQVAEGRCDILLGDCHASLGRCDSSSPLIAC